MKSIQGLSFRLFRANKFIIFSSILSVIIAVTLVLTLVLFSFSAKHTLKDEVKKMYGDMDLLVGYNPEQNKSISKEFVNEIQSYKEVKQLSKVSITHLNFNSLKAKVYTVGVENDKLARSRYHFSASLNKESVIINKSLAETLKVKVGDKLIIENQSFNLVEIINDLPAIGIVPDMVLLSNEVVKNYIQLKSNLDSQATFILIKATDNTNIFNLSNQIKANDKDLRIDIIEEDPSIKSNLNSLSIFIIILSILVLAIISLLVISNFELLFYKMKNQFAIMRSLGATTKQMSNIILIQSGIINIIGVFLGFWLTFISRKLMYNWMEKWLGISASLDTFNFKIAVIISLCCFGIIQVFLLFPTYKSSKILPIKIMEENEKLDFSYSKARVFFSKLLLSGSIFLILASQFITTRGEYSAVLLLIAAILMLLGGFLIFPIYLTKFLNGLLPYGQKIFGQEFYVAIKNLIPQVKKNTAIILTISSLMIVSIFGSSLVKTIKMNQSNQIKRDFPTPIIVNSRLGGDTQLDSKELSKAVSQLSTVENASSISNLGAAELKVGSNFVSVPYALVDLKELQDQKLIPNLIDKFDANSIVISQDFADENHLKIGETIQLGLYSNSAQRIELKGSYKVSAISDKLLSGAEIYMDWDNSMFKPDYIKFDQLFISSRDVDQTLKQLEVIKQQYPEVKISSYEESVKEANEMFYQRWTIFIVIICILVLTTIIGVFNSLANNIYSKRKEFAILRTMGIQPVGIRKIILTQVMMYLIVGLSIGVMAGILLMLIVYLLDPTGLFI
ncbi:ABC transporter permease, partial [Bacillus mycoides]|uniref:ABC transporter permease n=2 Tax=Bacillaceae TaxID=186817 RepID=UPI0009923C72